MSSKGTISGGGWRRRTLLAVGTVALVVLLLPLSAWLALRIPAFRAALLVRVGDGVAKASGVQVSASDFSLSIRDGRIELHEVLLAAAEDGAAPFLSLERVVAEADWKDLLRPPRRLRSLVLTAPRIDLEAGLPEAGGGSDGSPGSGLRSVEIENLEIREGVIERTSVPAGAEVWADALRGDGLEARGSLLDGEVSISDLEVRLTVESSRRPDISAALSGSLVFDGDRLSTRGVLLEGDALRLEVSGAAGVDGVGAARADFAFDAGLGRLFPDLGLGGRAVAAGAATFSPGEGRVQTRVSLDVTGFPAVLLEPWLEPVRHGDLDPAGTSLDLEGTVDADLSLGDGTLHEDRLEGDIRLRWRRDDEELLTADLRAFEDGATEGVKVTYDGRLLPASPGLRRLTGSLIADQWGELPLGGRFEAARLDLEVADLARLWSELGVSADGLAGWLPAGELSVTAVAEGPVARPDVVVTTRWRAEGEEILRAELRGRPGLTVATRAELDMTLAAELLPSMPGRRRVEAELRLPDWTEPASATILSAEADLVLPEAGEHLAATWGRLAGAFPAGPFDEMPEVLRLLSGEVFSGSLKSGITATGPVASPRLQSTGTWQPAAGEEVRWTLAAEVSETERFGLAVGPLEFEISDLDLERVEALLPAAEEDDERTWRPLAGRLSARATVSSLETGASARVEAELTDVVLGNRLDSGQVAFGAALEGERFAIEELHGSFSPSFRPSDGPVEITASGWATIARPFRDGALEARVERPATGVGTLSVRATVGDGRLELEAASPESGRIAVVAPLATLSHLAGPLGGLLPPPATGQAELTFDRTNLARWQEILERVTGSEPGRLRIDGAVDGLVQLDPNRLAAAEGRIEVTSLGLGVGEEESLVEEGSLQIEVGGGRLVVPETSWSLRGRHGLEAPVRFGTSLELSPSWRLGDPLAGLVASSETELNGRIDASALTPFLGGGQASGELVIEAEVHGAGTDLEAKVDLAGPGARVLFPATYPTLIEDPVVSLERRGGRWSLETGRFELNGGQTDLSLEELEGGAWRVGARVSGARYRLDHGLIADLDGDLSLTVRDTGRALLAGTLTLQRGVLRRDVSLEREILRLSAERGFEGIEDNAFSNVDLDIDIVTLDGIEVRNNLADLRADWSLLRVRGTLSDPRVSGRVDVDPGGIVTAFGQTVRIDEASLVLSGDPDVPPRLELETTSSFEDPRLRQNRADFWSSGLGEQGPGTGGLWDTWGRRGGSGLDSEHLAAGLTDHYANLFAQGLGSGFDRVQLSFEPLPILGETDTQARLTVSYFVSPQISLFTSQNPRRAEGRTEVLDLSNFAIRPSLRAQVFDDDDGRSGATLQELIRFGGGPSGEDASPRVRSVSIEAPNRSLRRRIRRAIEYRKGDAFPSGSELNVEVDALEALRRKGFPGAAVEVAVAPDTTRRVDLEIGVVPGTAVRYVFEGEKLPRRVRRSVRELYQPERLDRGRSLEEMGAEVTRALRARGHVHPEVTVEVEPTEVEQLSEVTIYSVGGSRIEPGPPRFPDLDPATEAELAGRFTGRLARVELAADLPGARAYLEQSLRGMGFTEPEVGEVVLDDAGRELTVRLRPGHRTRIGRVAVVGMSAEEADPVLARLGVAVGEPLRSGRLTQAALSLEDILRERGHLQAEVEALVEGQEGSKEADSAIRFDAAPGPVSRVGTIELEGLRASRPSWVRKKLDLTEGEVLGETDLQAARRNLSRTGVFHRIGIEVGDEEGAGEERRLRVEVEERPRYLLGLGARWQEDSGLGVVVDSVDQHFLGRGQTFGARVFYSQIDKRLRLFHAMPLGRDLTLETFVEARDEKDPALNDLETRGLEAWVQLSFPLTDSASTRFYGVARRRRFKQSGLDEGLISPSDNTPFLGWQILFDTRGADRGDLPARRWSFFYGHDLVGFSESLGGDATGLGFFGHVKLELPLLELSRGGEAPRELGWIQSYRVGWIEAFEGELPFADRLRAGGEYSVRGYPTDSLGPSTPDGLPLGGELMLIINQELRIPLAPRLVGVGFFDAGNVWIDRSTVDSKLFTSAGVGLRYASPVGPLRLDWAFPLDRREGDPSSKVYFGFGPTF